ncbi:two-component sensor histidine kinase [Cohnella sp. CIP 111063]|mgnify:CR=1 FL=1|uniref:sensor histidine kinase n=1 Tax=unclassified Cohnella TaxID=2636738 RepID=UPI000B8BE334|nr:MULTISPECIES: histidine kinase [unclassified Cohnella]OXS58434.1 two-component sensor histidine kinase [Cohnella sp. CIP 111063]PRX71725.1 two-component system nitrate/nitrite sensor histidine kinase NarQ [Cohnella sp. SGD-V74]
MDNRSKDRRIKWLILLIPTLTIGLWEYVRHAFLLPYVSMELGNLLAPFIVLAVTLTLVRSLFARMEQSQMALQREKEAKAALEERESLARELHDGISQSMFLLAVKLDQLDELSRDGPVRELAGGLRETVRVMHEDVRQAIANLRQPPSPDSAAWVVPLRELLGETAELSGARAEFVWTIPDDGLTDKEKVELHACVREALVNVRKHAQASHVYVVGEPDGAGGFRCRVEDDGVGFDGDPLQAQGRFGLRMVRDRARSMGWSFLAERRGERTVVELVKSGRKAEKG